MFALRDKETRAKLEREFAERLATAVKEVREGLAPIVQDHVSSRQEAHKKALLDGHADFVEVMPKVEQWIATQPAYLRGPMAQVFEAGAAQDVIDLFTRYKKETGYTAPPASTTNAPAPPNAATERSAAELEHVPSRRVNPAPDSKGGPDKNDYDAAWEEATAAGR